MDKNMILFYNLPDDVLIMIFEHCDLITLLNLSLTCKKFSNIIHNEDTVYKEASMSVVGSNMASPYMLKRCKPILSYKDRIITSRKWGISLGKRTVIYVYKTCKPWLTLDRELIYLSTGNQLSSFKRRENGTVNPLAYVPIFSFRENIEKFAVTEKEVVCAGSDGSLVRLTRNFNTIHLLKAHSRSIYAVDMKDNIIVSASRSIKVWNTCSKETKLKGEVPLGTTVLSTAIMPSNNCFIIGTYDDRILEPLQLFDLERCCRIVNFGRNSRKVLANVREIYPECCYTALTASNALRLWDIRCPHNSVAVWNEPYFNCLFCVKSDHNVTILTGTSQNKCMIWDKRMLSLPLKNYCIPEYPSSPFSLPINCVPPSPPFHHSGPIYSLAFDATNIFLGLRNTSYQFSYTDLAGEDDVYF